MTPRLVVFLCLVALGCASTNQAPESFVNPEDCAAAVQRARDDLKLRRDSPPEPEQVEIPSGLVPGVGRAVIPIYFVVDEHGRVETESLALPEGLDPAARESLRRAALEWRFQPARIATCWVPAFVDFKIEVQRVRTGA